MDDNLETISFDELYEHLLDKPWDYVDLINDYFNSVRWFSIEDYYKLNLIFWRIYERDEGTCS